MPLDISALAGPAAAVLNIIIWVIGIVLLAGAGFLAFRLYSSQKKYKQFQCIIWRKDGFGQLAQVTDQAGIFVDKLTKNKRLFLKRSGVGLSPDNIPYLPSGSKKIIYLYQTGLKNFQFIKPNISTSISLSMTEEDVNWGLNSYERAKKQFSHNVLLQYMPYIALAIASMVILIIFIYFFKQFGILKEVAVAFRDAAQSFAMAKSGTVILP